jgi:hypothetical protein
MQLPAEVSPFSAPQSIIFGPFNIPVTMTRILLAFDEESHRCRLVVVESQLTPFALKGDGS